MGKWEKQLSQVSLKLAVKWDSWGVFKMTIGRDEDPFIDYLYEEKEDYFSNIDYTHPETLEHLDNALPPETDLEVRKRLQRPFVAILG